MGERFQERYGPWRGRWRRALDGLLECGDLAYGFMQQLGIEPEHGSVVRPAKDAARAAQREATKGNKGIFVGAAIELKGRYLVIPICRYFGLRGHACVE